MPGSRRFTKLFSGAKKRPKKRRSSRASANHPEYQALFGKTSAHSTTEPSQSSSLSEESLNHAASPDQRTVSPKRSSFAQQPAPESSFPEQVEPERSVAKPNLAKFNDNDLEGLRLALLRSLDDSLISAQRTTVVKIIESLSPNDTMSVKENISRLLPVIEDELAARRLVESKQILPDKCGVPIQDQLRSVRR